GALDIVAHLATDEPFGLAVVEAMASGRPIVAGRGGGVLEIIRDGVDGLLVAQDDAAEIGAAIESVLTEPSRAAQLVASARERVQECFTPERQSAQMLHVYQSVVSARANGPADS